MEAALSEHDFRQDDVSASDRRETDAQHSDERDPTRRTLLRRGGRVLVYSAPLIQLFHPPQALAGSASPIS